MTKACDTREDLIGRLRPHEELRRLVVHGQVSVDGRLEVAGAAVDAASELLLSEQREPPLDQVDPQEDPNDRTKLLPPAVGFVWGSFSFAGMIDSMEESLEFFSPEGIPQRASVTLALSQQRITEFAFEKNAAPPPGTGSGNTPVGTRPLAQATAGASLQSIASASGKTDWQSIAAANGIENPRILQPGQLVDLNAGLRLPSR